MREIGIVVLTVDGQRRVAADRFDPRAHPFERRDDAPHGATRQRGVADEGRREPVAGQKARQQPHGLPQGQGQPRQVFEFSDDAADECFAANDVASFREA